MTAIFSMHFLTGENSEINYRQAEFALKCISYALNWKRVAVYKIKVITEVNLGSHRNLVAIVCGSVMF